MSKRTKGKYKRIVDATVQHFDREVLIAFGKTSFFVFDKRREKKRLRKFRRVASNGESFKFKIDSKI